MSNELYDEKLIIFEYVDEDKTYTEWFWTKNRGRENIINECYDWIAEANRFTDKEARDFYTVNNFWIVEEAVKSDSKCWSCGELI